MGRGGFHCCATAFCMESHFLDLLHTGFVQRWTRYRCKCHRGARKMTLFFDQIFGQLPNSSGAPPRFAKNWLNKQNDGTKCGSKRLMSDIVFQIFLNNSRRNLHGVAVTVNDSLLSRLPVESLFSRVAHACADFIEQTCQYLVAPASIATKSGSRGRNPQQG